MVNEPIKKTLGLLTPCFTLRSLAGSDELHRLTRGTVRIALAFSNSNISFFYFSHNTVSTLSFLSLALSFFVLSISLSLAHSLALSLSLSLFSLGFFSSLLSTRTYPRTLVSPARSSRILPSLPCSWTCPSLPPSWPWLLHLLLLRRPSCTRTTPCPWS